MCLVAIGAATASAQISTSPSTLNFGQVGLGLQAAIPMTVTNNGSAAVTVDSFTFGMTQFGLTDGTFPRTLNPHSTAQWSVTLRPAAARSYTTKLTINLEGGTTYTVQMSGAGVANKGAATLSTNSINFGSVPLGTTVTQSVTVTNTGTQSFALLGINTYVPFSASGITKSATLNPNTSATFQVSYSATSLGPVTGAVTIDYNQLPSSGIDLSATGIASAGLAITSYATLPAATKGYAYLATLQATGGTPPYTWQLNFGNVSGVTFSPGGSFGGSVASNVAAGKYAYTVEVQDSSSPHNRAAANLTLPVMPATKANCNVTSIDVTGAQTPVQALNDLGTGTYQGQQGGLYPSGSNVNPQRAAGASIAQGIQPLDATGNPDPNGVYALLALGESATQQPFSQFIPAANADPEKNSHLVVVNGALGGETADRLAQSGSGYLTTIQNYILPFAGVTPQQVAVAWVDAVDSQGGAFPGDAQNLQSELETIAQDLHSLFPNLKLAYFGSLNYTGYSEGVSTINPEPLAYETGFADKWAIQDQINGDPKLNYDSSKGPVTAPWMGWGSYYWANGLLARTDGTYWSCQDLQSDGTHPVFPGGELKIAYGLLNFFKTDSTATPWFLAPGARPALPNQK
jgi:hypothetical protein